MISLAELSPAERLLVKLAQRHEIRAPLDGEDMLLEERTFRERFTRLAMSHGVYGLVLSAIVRTPLMQSLSAAQNAGNTLVVGVPNFVPLKNGRAGSAEQKPEDGAS